MVALKWIEVNNREQLVGKIKEFKTREALEKFMIKLQEKANFIRIDAISE